MKYFIQRIQKVVEVMFLLGCAAAVAEEPAKEVPKETHAGPVFVISSWGDWKGPELFVKQEAKWKLLEIMDLGYSAELTYKRSEPVVIVRKVMTEKGEQYVPFISVAIPEACRKPLIMLVPDPKVGARTMVVDLDPKEFPWGSYKFVNFTGAKLDGLVNRTGFHVEPGGLYMFNPGKDENTRLAIQVKAMKGDQSELVYSNMVINRPSKRMLVFFHPSTDAAGGASIDTRCLVDFRQQDEVKP